MNLEIFQQLVIAEPGTSLFSENFTPVDYSIGAASIYDTHTVTIDFAGPTLASGTYVISLYDPTLLDIPVYSGGSGMALQQHQSPFGYTQLETFNGTPTSIGFELDGVPVSATPLPATLPLFASGLGALGLLGWRRKRKAQAVA